MIDLDDALRGLFGVPDPELVVLGRFLRRCATEADVAGSDGSRRFLFALALACDAEARRRDRVMLEIETELE